MEKEKNRIYTIVALVALAALLLSCIAGAMAGGVVGAIVSRRQAQSVAERIQEKSLQGLPRLREQPPWQLPDWPLTPVPGLPEGLPPSGMLPPGAQGAFILEIVPDTPAEAVGLRPGDLIVAIDSTPIDRLHLLHDVIGQYEPGDRITVHFRRGDQEDSVRVKLAEHPEVKGQAYLGIYFTATGAPDLETP
jgi:membrane-associated protease RseP (regulator of RpoE activity)